MSVQPNKNQLEANSLHYKMTPFFSYITAALVELLSEVI